jgi:hypothetical protein
LLKDEGMMEKKVVDEMVVRVLLNHDTPLNLAVRQEGGQATKY